MAKSSQLINILQQYLTHRKPGGTAQTPCAPRNDCVLDAQARVFKWLIWEPNRIHSLSFRLTIDLWTPQDVWFSCPLSSARLLLFLRPSSFSMTLVVGEVLCGASGISHEATWWL